MNHNPFAEPEITTPASTDDQPSFWENNPMYDLLGGSPAPRKYRPPLGFLPPGMREQLLKRLPLDPEFPENPLPEQTAATAGKLSDHRQRVLVVDDEPAASEAMVLLLESMGHEAREIHDSIGVVTEVAAFNPDLILLDLEMPAPDGFQVARTLRQCYPAGTPKLVALGDCGSEQIRQRIDEAGFDWHLLKPADWDSLATLLSDLHWPGL